VRHAFLTMVLLALCGSLAAQQPAPPPYPQPRPAPQKGAPLDPADVDVLTGKTGERRNYARPYVWVQAPGPYGTRWQSFPGTVPHGAGLFLAAPLRTPLLFPLAGRHGGTVVVIRR
jgi:hypothetical protein